MTCRHKWLLDGVFVIICCCWFAGVGQRSAVAEDITVEARLVWGTNESTSKNPEHQPVDQETLQKLRKIFKWKNYFLEKRLVETVAHRSTKRLAISKDCSIEVKELAGLPVEISLIGKGKPVNKTTKPFNRGEWIVIGGEDSNECAWFVILNRL